MAKSSRVVSMRPSKQTGGFTFEGDGTIKEAIWARWADAGEEALKGGRDEDDPVLKLVIEPDEGDEVPPQYLSHGKASVQVPSEDGEKESESGDFLIAAEDAERPSRGMAKSSNASLFLRSLCKPENGKIVFDENRLDDGIHVLEGVHAHFAPKPQPRRRGLDEDEEGGSRERTYLAVDEIYDLPGKAGRKTSRRSTQKATSKAAAKKTSRKSKPAEEEEEEEEEESGGDVGELAQGIVVKILDKSKDGSVPASSLVRKAFVHLKSLDRGTKKEVNGLLQDDDFLGDEDAPWEYDADEGTLSAVEE